MLNKCQCLTEILVSFCSNYKMKNILIIGLINSIHPTLCRNQRHYKRVREDVVFVHLYECLIMLEEVFGLVIRSPYFQHYGKQLLAILVILLLVQKFHWLTNIHCLLDSIIKRQQMSHCTPSEKLIILPLLAPQLSFIMCVTLADRTPSWVLPF